MCEPCTENFLNCVDCCNFCNGSCQRTSNLLCRPGLQREEKFSNVIIPSFLYDRTKSRGKPEPSNKNRKILRNVKSKDKGVNNEKGRKICDNDNRKKVDSQTPVAYAICQEPAARCNENQNISNNAQCKDKGYNNEKEKEICANDNTNKVNEQTPVANPICQVTALPNIGTYQNCTANPTPTVFQAPDGSTLRIENIPPCAVYPGVINPTNQLSGMNMEYGAGNQIPPRLCDMPAAGLPSKQTAMFDPCTGRELQQLQPQPGQQGLYFPCAAPVNPGYFPYFYPNLMCSLPPRETFDNGAKAPLQNPSGKATCSAAQEYPKKMTCPAASDQSQEYPEKSTCCDSSAPFQEYPRKTPVSSASGPPSQICPGGASTKDKNRVDKPSPKTQVKDNKEHDLRFTLSRPNCTGKTTSSTNSQIVNCCNATPDLIERICTSLQVPRQPDSCYLLLPINMSPKSDKSEESIPKSKRPKKTPSKDRINTSDQNANNEENSSKPTRNCGCNTLISGNIEGKPQASRAKKDDADCCASSCNSGCCCWPRYCYYYNPYTGYYCWYKNRCCYGGNTCCNCSCNHCCSNSCPIPTQSSKANLEPDASKTNKRPNSAPTSKSALENDKRIAGGATNSFDPEIQDLYDRWMEFNEHAFNATQFPMTTPTPNYRTTSPMQNTQQQKHATDFNWVPL